jgi:hypothetical protein
MMMGDNFAAAAASGRWASDGDQSDVMALLARKWRVGEASSFKVEREGGQKKAVPLLCHLNCMEEVFQ